MSNQTQWLAQLPALAGSAYLFAVAPRLTLTDLRERRLPNRLVLPGFPVALVGQLLAILLDARLAGNLFCALAAAAVGFTLTLLANQRFGLGMGDVKLYSLIALSLGWFGPWLPALVWLFASLTGVLQIGVGALRNRTLRLHGTIALGPHLLAGFALAASAGAWFWFGG